jgi:hypothetical protein
VFGFFIDDWWLPAGKDGGPSETDPSINFTAVTGLSAADVDAMYNGWVQTMTKGHAKVIAAGGMTWNQFYNGGNYSVLCPPDQCNGHSTCTIGGPPFAREQCAQFMREVACAGGSEVISAPLAYFVKKNKDYPPFTGAVDLLQHLAAFLLIRGPHAWFGYSWSGCFGDFDENGNPLPVNITFPSVFRQDYGTPTAQCRETAHGSGVFVRDWSKASIALDCNTWAANITLKSPAAFANTIKTTSSVVPTHAKVFATVDSTPSITPSNNIVKYTSNTKSAAAVLQRNWTRLWGANINMGKNEIGAPFAPCVQNMSGFGTNLSAYSAACAHHGDCCFPNEMLQVSAAFRIGRIDVNWDVIESTKGVYANWSRWDQLFAAMEKEQVQLYAILDVNNWPGNKIYDKGAPPHSDEAVSAFVKWALTAMKRYHQQGAVWELWNEPNGPTCAFNATQYSRLANALGAAVRGDAELTDTVVLVGPASSGIDIPWIESVLVTGVLEYWDAVSVHPYRVGAPETVLSEYDGLRKLIDSYTPISRLLPDGSNPIQIVCGEWGYPAGTPTPAEPHCGGINCGLDMITQASYLARQWLLNALVRILASTLSDFSHAFRSALASHC